MRNKCLVHKCKLLASKGCHFLPKLFVSTASAAAKDTHWETVGHSCIIEDKDLLRKSKDPCGSGLHIFDLVDRGALEPDLSLYGKLLKRCTQSGKIHLGRIIHNHLFNSRFKSDVSILNTIINMYSKCGCLDEARKVFDGMPEKDMVTWTCLITACSQNNCPGEALVLFPRMLSLGFEPNQFTLSSVLKACGGGNEPDCDHGRQVHAFCVKGGWSIDVYVGSAVVDMYVRCGLMDEALMAFNELEQKNEVCWNALIAGHARKSEGDHALRIYSMMQREDFTPTHFTYSSLFSVCASTGSLEQGKWVHARMIKSGEKLTAFVGNTLLDMYAKSGSIEDAKMVFDRKMMKEGGVKKEPACSWVEIENAVHMFVANDDAHPQREEIYKMWEQMTERIRKIGYVPDTSHVLSFVDQQEREAKLQAHSEKLALAFALLNTVPGSTIRIKKNIRVCGDCHNAIKFVSKCRKVIKNIYSLDIMGLGDGVLIKFFSGRTGSRFLLPRAPLYEIAAKVDYSKVNSVLEIPKNVLDSTPMVARGLMHKLRELIDRKGNVKSSETDIEVHPPHYYKQWHL
ncbi:DYW domain [Dillenia turbinata]|uniref:DYW domain n=1 Tax=Dillenia turbinata TaxID=194707 RepID=A0AAN8UUK4_9MAGN